MRWLMILVLFTMSGLFCFKGIELWALLGNDASQISGISFLGLRIQDHVMKESIGSYALGFTISSFIPLLVAFNLFMKMNKPPKDVNRQRI